MTTVFTDEWLIALALCLVMASLAAVVLACMSRPD